MLLRETPSSRARTLTFSPASIRRKASSLNSRLNRLGSFVLNQSSPRKENCHHFPCLRLGVHSSGRGCHHPHVHMIVPGGGISLDGERWIACRRNFFLSVHVLSRLFRRLVLEKLTSAYQAGKLQFFGKHVSLTNPRSFAAYLAPLRDAKWVVYSKQPFGGPEEVLR